MRAVYALYSDPAAARRAFGRLRSLGPQLGFGPSDICVLSSEPFEEYDFGWREQKTLMPWLAALGGIVGGTAGYMLASLTQRSYPLPTGAMPIVALWPTGVVVYELTMLGAILATLFTLLVTARSPRATKKIHDAEVAGGMILIGVASPPDAARVEIIKTLGDAGASRVKEFEAGKATLIHPPDQRSVS